MHPKTTYKQLVELVTVLAGVPIEGHALAVLKVLSDRARELLGETPRGDVSYDAQNDQITIRVSTRRLNDLK